MVPSFAILMTQPAIHSIRRIHCATANDAKDRLQPHTSEIVWMQYPIDHIRRATMSMV